MAVHVGDKLKNRYRIEESLGRGGMADVYKVWDEERSTYLALKLLRDDLAQDPVFMRRFRREAHNLAQLQHPNIVRFYGLEEDDLKAFILMEYIEGQTLREEIRRAGSGGMSQERIQSVLKDVCSALHYAHNKGLVHCDIKSGNILIDASGKAYLTDFGIARGMDMATSTMVGIGTPVYMAPELIKGQDPTPQTDIYALGIVLYEMLSGGERPFTGERATITGTTAEKVRWEHLRMEPTPLPQLNPKVNQALQAVVECCLQKQPERRFHSVQELLSSLHGSVKGVESRTQTSRRASERGSISIEKGNDPKKVSDKLLFVNGNTNKKREKDLQVKKKKGISLILLVLITISFLIGIPVTINIRNTHIAQTAQSINATVNALSATATAAFEATQTANVIYVLDNPIQLVEDDTDNYLECEVFGWAKNFHISMEILNPSDIANGFEYGILFRDYGGNDQYRLQFYESGNWDLLNRVDDESTTISSGSYSSFNGESNASNVIDLIVNNDVGFLSINGKFVSSLDLSDRNRSGSIGVCTDLSNGYGKTGNSIRIDDLFLERIVN